MIQRNDEPLPLSQTECLVCGYVMEGHQCNLVCPNCGYREDCSDAFRAGPMEQPAEERERDNRTSGTGTARNGDGLARAGICSAH